MKNNKKLYSIALASIAMILMLVSIAGAAPYAYVPNSGDGTVSVIDTSTNTVTATVHVGSYPTGVSVNPAGKTVYVTNTLSDTVSVIDTSTHNVTSTVAVGSSPVGVSVNPAGTMVYVANCDDDTVSVIDTSTNTVTSTVPVGNDPSGVSVNPAGTMVYVANYEDGTVSVIDTSTNTVISTVSVGNDPSGVSVNPAGTKVYVANYDDDTVSVIDTSTNTVTSTVSVGSGPSGVSVNPAGTTVYVTNPYDDTVSVIDTSTNTVTSTVPVGISPFGISVNPAGTMVYVVNTDDGTVSVIDTSTDTVTSTVPVGSGPYAFGQFITVLEQNPSYNIDKTITDVAGKGPSGAVTVAGDVISYQVRVTNDGNLNLTNVNVVDSLINLSGPTGDNSPSGILNVGENWTYTGTYTVTQADLNNNGGGDGFITNTATVDSDELGPESYIVTVPLKQNPAYTIDKTVTDVAENGSTANVTAAGDVISYQVNVENDGNIDLTNVIVTDPLLGTLTGPTGDNSASGTLNVGEIWTYTGTYTVTQADLNNNGGGDGFITNTATVDCDELDQESDIAEVSIEQNPAYTIDKIVTDVAGKGSSGDVTKAGDVISYQVNVTNNGNIDLTNVSVTDPLLGNLTGPAESLNADGVLEVGENWTYTGNYTVTQEDINSNGGGDGFINNTASVDCDELDQESDSAAVPISSSFESSHSGGTGSARIIPKSTENVEVNKNVTEIMPVENTGDIDEHTGNEVADVEQETEQETEQEEGKSAPGFEMICGIVGLLGTFLYRRR